MSIQKPVHKCSQQHYLLSQKNGWQEISLEATGKVQEKEIMVTCINVVGMKMEKMGRITGKIYKMTSNPDLWERVK